MAAKPRMMVRLAPSTLHALAFIAGRETETPGEMARNILTAGIQAYLDRKGWQMACQTEYMRWLDTQSQKTGRAESPDQDDFDELAGLAAPAPAPAQVPVHVEPAAAPGQHAPLFAGAPAWRAPTLEEQDRRVSEALLLRATGQKRRS